METHLDCNRSSWAGRTDKVAKTFTQLFVRSCRLIWEGLISPSFTGGGSRPALRFMISMSASALRCMPRGVENVLLNEVMKK